MSAAGMLMLWLVAGTAHAQQQGAIPAGTKYAAAESVSCPSANRCVMVGSPRVSGWGPFTQGAVWTTATPAAGTGWTMSELPTTVAAPRIHARDVACTSTVCVVAGEAFLADQSVEYADRRATVFTGPAHGGGPWTRLELAIPSGQIGGMLDEVSCPAGGALCIVSGATVSPNGSGTESAWISTDPASGTWRKIEVEHPNGGLSSVQDVQCLTATHCIATGTAYSGGAKAYVWHSTSTPAAAGAWSAVELPKGALAISAGANVSCTSATWCLVNGIVGVSDGLNTIEHAAVWTSSAPATTAWTMEQMPETGTGVYSSYSRAEHDAECVTPVLCFSAGWLVASNNGQPTSQGAVWTSTTPGAGGWAAGTTTMPTYPLTASTTEMYGASCVTATLCYAHGYAYYPEGPFFKDYLFMTQTPGAGPWTPIELPVPLGYPKSEVYDVECISTSFCVAYGYSRSADNFEFHGTVWTTTNPTQDDWKISLVTGIAPAVAPPTNNGGGGGGGGGNGGTVAPPSTCGAGYVGVPPKCTKPSLPLMLVGGRANATFVGGLAADRFTGGRGSETFKGGAGNDIGNGGIGNDRLFGQAGNDKLSGGVGNDKLDGGAGTDVLDGGPGNDTIVANADKNAKDTVRCGAGKDVVIADKKDKVAKDCEKVMRR